MGDAEESGEGAGELLAGSVPLLIETLRSLPSGLCRRVSSAPPGLINLAASLPRLAPLRQAQGRLWAAFFRRFAAAASQILFHSRNANPTLVVSRGFGEFIEVGHR